jgi:hypothetical protein
MFTSWDGFTVEWDLGIDDAKTMATRPEKWFLWGVRRDRVVRVNRDNPRDGLKRIVDAGFGTRRQWSGKSHETHPTMRLLAEAGVVFTADDYKRILNGVQSRKGW